MKNVIRYDRGELRPAVKTDEGFLQFEGYATRVGIFEYLRPDGSISRELRPPEEVFREDSYATLRLKPVLLTHSTQRVDSKIAEKHVVGSVSSEVEPTEQFLKIVATAYTEKAVNAIEKQQMLELSCGYRCDMDETPGVWNGEAYDRIQRNIVYNHVAIVKKGRAGSQVRMRLDDANCEVLDNENFPNGKGEEMEGNTKRGRSFRVKTDAPAMVEVEMAGEMMEAQQSAPAHDSSEKVAALESEVAQKQAKIDELNGMIEALRAEKEQAEANLVAQKNDAENQIKVDAEQRKQMVKECAQLWALAAHIKIDNYQDLELDALKRALVAKRYPKIQVDSFTNEEIQGMVRILAEDAGESPLEAIAKEVSRSLQTKNDRAESSYKTVSNADAIKHILGK